MKRLISAVLCIVFMIMVTLPVYANSTPSYWKAYPYSEVLAVDENCPITVESEQLTYDFSKNDEYGNNRSPIAKVTASYEMTNPTSETLSVQMAFPFVSSLSTLSVPDIIITADGEALPFEIFPDTHETNPYGDSGNGFTYSGVGDITNQELALFDFDISKARLYHFTVDAGDYDMIDFEIRFNIGDDKTVLIASGFTRDSYSAEDGSSLGARIRETEEMELLVLGDDLEYTFAAYTESGEELSAESYGCTVSVSEADTKQYLLSAMSQSMEFSQSDAVSDTQLFNLCISKIFEESITTGFTMWENVLYGINTDRIITLVYTVKFPAQATQNVSVSYLTDGVMDRRETVSPTYSYTYLLSPAKSWAGFGTLNIEIITPQKARYITQSSLALSADGKNRYTAQLIGLPEEELTFTLYEHKKITAIDKLKKKIYELNYFIYFFWPVIAITLAIVIIIILRAVIRRRYKAK